MGFLPCTESKHEQRTQQSFVLALTRVDGMHQGISYNYYKGSPRDGSLYKLFSDLQLYT